jgi:hypothetical protein
MDPASRHSKKLKEKEKLHALSINTKIWFRGQWWAHINRIMNLEVPQNVSS